MLTNRVCVCMYDIWRKKKLSWQSVGSGGHSIIFFLIFNHASVCCHFVTGIHTNSIWNFTFSLILWTFLSMQFLLNNKTYWPSAMLWIFLIYVLMWNEKKSNEKNQIKKAIQIFWYNVESQWMLTYKSLIKEMSWSIYRHVIS